MNTCPVIRREDSAAYRGLITPRFPFVVAGHQLNDRLFQPQSQRKDPGYNMIPRCACGCGRLARIVADVVFSTGIDCRAPWLDTQHAFGANNGDGAPTIDVVVDADAFQAVLESAPCWCQMRSHTTLYWCPKHGIDTRIDQWKTQQ